MVPFDRATSNVTSPHNFSYGLMCACVKLPVGFFGGDRGGYKKGLFPSSAVCLPIQVPETPSQRHIAGDLKI